MKKLLCSLVVCLTICSEIVYSAPDQKSSIKKQKIEIGVLTGGQYLSEYRGSKSAETKGVLLPMPYYNGDFLKVDRNGARAEIFANHLVELKLSAEASLSGGGKKSEARVDMPELQSAFELGPSFNVNLTGEGFHEGLELAFPLRAVVVAEPFDAEYIGYALNPKFTYKFPPIWGGWRVKASLGGFWGSSRYHEYYYDVAPEFVTATRSAYESGAGFSGSYFKTSIRQRKGQFLYSFSARYDNLSGAVIEDSPLVETTHYFSFSAAMAYMFWSF